MPERPKNHFFVSVWKHIVHPQQNDFRLSKNKLDRSQPSSMIIADAPPNLVGDNACDSDKLDAELRQYGAVNILKNQ